jgi:hypothetical protein
MRTEWTTEIWDAQAKSPSEPHRMEAASRLEGRPPPLRLRDTPEPIRAM